MKILRTMPLVLLVFLHLRADGQTTDATKSSSTYIPDSLVAPRFTPPAPPVEKKLPEVRVDAAVTVPTEKSRTLTIVRGEASTLPDLRLPENSKAEIQRPITPEEAKQFQSERQHSLFLGATIFDHRISLVHWHHPDTGQYYEALCGFDVGLLEGLGGFVHQGEEYSLMLMSSEGDLSEELRQNNLSDISAGAIRILKGDPKDPLGTAPVTAIGDLIKAEKSRLVTYQAARQRYLKDSAAWNDAHPPAARDETFWFKPHRGSRYLAQPQPEKVTGGAR